MFILVAFAAFACKKKENNTVETGTVKMYMTDAPIDASNVQAVYITVKEINIKTNDGWNALDGFQGPKKFNLFDLTDSNSVFLGTETLPAGNYQEIRFVLEAPEENGGDASNPGCYLEFKDGTQEPLFVPSGSSSGFKAKGSFSVPANGTVDIIADFDARKSIVMAGNSGKYILKPVIRIEALNEAGAIEGAVTDTLNKQVLNVYAYEDGAYTNSEAATPASGDPWFPNAVTSDKVENGTYGLYFLAPGVYDIAVAEFDSIGNFQSVLGFVKDVQVSSKSTVTADFNTASLSSTP